MQGIKVTEMKVTNETSSPLEAVLSIELEPEDIDPYLDKAYKRLVQRVQIPGFRKGKAPRSLLENLMGRDALLREAIDQVVPDFIEKAATQEDIKVFSHPNIDLLNLDPMSIKATIPLKPTVDLGDYKTIRKTRQPVDVEDSKVTEILEKMRYNSTPWEPSSSPVAFDDLVTIDVTGKIDGASIFNQTGYDFVPQGDNDYPMPGFSDQLIGLQKEEEKRFDISFPTDHANKDVAGKQCKCTVKVLEIKTKNLPELDDEFAKTAGESYENIEDMRANVLEQLTNQAELSSQRAFQDELLEEIFKMSTVKMSSLLIEREIAHLMESQQQSLKERNVSMDAYLEQMGKSEDELKDELRVTATERLEKSLVIQEFSHVENIKIEDDDIDTEIEQITATSSNDNNDVRKFFESSNGRASIVNSIMRRRICEKLEEIAIQHNQSEEFTPTNKDTSTINEEGDTDDTQH